MRKIGLKPCPFCGHEAIMLLVESNLYAVTCKDVNCAAQGGVMTSEIDATEVWNRKVDDEN